MSNYIKKLLALVLSILFVLSFSACGKTNEDAGGSTIPNDQTQDFEQESFWDDEYTDEEKEQIKDLWNDGVGNGEITETPSNLESSNTSGTTSTGSNSSQAVTSTTTPSTSGSSSSENSSVDSSQSSTESSSQEDSSKVPSQGTNNGSSDAELAPEIPSSKPNGIF